MNKLQVLEYEINTKLINEEDYVSLTDIAKKVNGDEPRFVIQNWMRNKDTIDYLGLWEKIYNPNFNSVGFEAVKNEAGRNRFTMMDTLSPIIQAIGADMKFSIENMDKTRNIITEGITDYMYISAIMIYLNVKDKPYIIPSAGVANINRIASILLGWGCEFKIIVDYDNAGNKEYKQLNKKLCLELNKDVFYVNLENYKERIEEENWRTIESLIDEKDFEKLENKLDGTDEMKKLVAKEFYDKIREKNIELEEKTINNFKLLLRALDIL